MQETIDRLMFEVRRRNQYVRARTALTLQIKAVERSMAGGKGKTVPPEMELALSLYQQPLEVARATLKGPITQIEREIAALCESLPVAEWWCDFRGQNLLGLATIIGAAGDLSRFRSPSALWKWFGLHVSNGWAPKGESGEKMDHARWRRAVVKVVGTSIKMAGGETSPYRAVYDARKAFETAKNEAGEYAERAQAMMRQGKNWSENQKKVMQKGMLTPAHIDARAMRYMEKRLLRDLWRKWRDLHQEEPIESKPVEVEVEKPRRRRRTTEEARAEAMYP